MNYFKKTKLHHSEGCYRLDIDLATEDLVVYGDYLIGATADSRNLYRENLSASSASPGFLFAANPKTGEIYNITMHNFPSNIQMNGHGMNLYKDTLYVISHSYTKGGEIVILFKLEFKEKIEAYYLKHIDLGETYGAHNSIAVYDDNSFFISQWLPFPDPAEGRDHSFFTSTRRSLLFTFTKSTGIKLCKITEDTAECDFKAYTYSANGINLINNTLYVSDCATDTLLIYSVSDSLELSLIQSLKLSHLADNIHYHDNSIYITGLSRKADIAILVENEKRGLPLYAVPGGVSRVDITEKTIKAEEIIMQDILSFPTASAIIKDKLVLSSEPDPSLLVCPFPIQK